LAAPYDAYWIHSAYGGPNCIVETGHRSFRLLGADGLSVALEYESFAILDVAFSDTMIVIAGPCGERVGLSAITGRLCWRVVDAYTPIKKVTNGQNRKEFVAVIELKGGRGAVANLCGETGNLVIVAEFPIRPNAIGFLKCGSVAITSQGEAVQMWDGQRENVLGKFMDPIETFPPKRKLP